MGKAFAPHFAALPAAGASSHDRIPFQAPRFSVTPSPMDGERLVGVASKGIARGHLGYLFLCHVINHPGFIRWLKNTAI